MNTIGLAIRLKKRGKAANGGNAAELSRPRVRVQAESLYAQGAICGTLTVQWPVMASRAAVLGGIMIDR